VLLRREEKIVICLCSAIYNGEKKKGYLSRRGNEEKRPTQALEKRKTKLFPWKGGLSLSLQVSKRTRFAEGPEKRTRR